MRSRCAHCGRSGLTPSMPRGQWTEVLWGGDRCEQRCAGPYVDLMATAVLVECRPMRRAGSLELQAQGWIPYTTTTEKLHFRDRSCQPYLQESPGSKEHRG